MANKIVGHIPYSLGLRRANPSEQDSAMKVYPCAQQYETIDLPLLAKHVREHGSSFSAGTIYGVLTDTVECVIEMLRAGYGVKLDGLGKFGVSLSSEGVEDSDKFSPSLITKVNLTFNADEAVKTALNTNMEYDYVATRLSQAAAKKAEKLALNEEMGSADSSQDDSSQGGSGSGDPGDVTP